MTSFRPLVALLVCVGVLGAEAASAAPSTPATLTYEFKNCKGSFEGDFSAVKQPSGAAGLQVVGFKATFVFMQSIDAAGNVEFTTPGFEHNGLPTVTCDLTLNQQKFLVTGLLAPVKK
jgi:hypothetical protein